MIKFSTWLKLKEAATTSSGGGDMSQPTDSNTIAQFKNRIDSNPVIKNKLPCGKCGLAGKTVKMDIGNYNKKAHGKNL